MAKVIWKYPITQAGGEILALPKGYRVLSADIQGRGGPRETIVIWVLVDPTQKAIEPCVIACLNTGDRFDETAISGLTFLGTVTSSNGIVWHVFAGKEG